MLHTTTNRKSCLATMSDEDATRQALQNGLGRSSNVLGTNTNAVTDRLV